MDLIFVIFFIGIAGCDIQCLPISNGFTVKFNSISAKEDVKPKSFGAMFAKVPQESSPEATIRREILSNAYIRLNSDLAPGCTNQISKIMFPISTDDNDSVALDNSNVINLPVIRQPFDEYKLLVVTAPPNIKIGGDNTPTVVYIVFPEDDANALSSIKIPSIYFVNKDDGSIDGEKKQDKIDPIFIMDSNRTVTGIRSKKMAKYVKFRNKLITRYGYEIVQ